MSLTDSSTAQTRTARLERVALSNALGAEIRGVDLRQPQDATVIAALGAAWHDSMVIVLRDQQISAEDQRRFCGYFGHVGQHPSF